MDVSFALMKHPPGTVSVGNDHLSLLVSWYRPCCGRCSCLHGSAGFASFKCGQT
ncbi:hypothetical protein J2X09_004292 [Hydrogenophaga laconesensis]|uniref:Uncharacterized protein n=1 Tax=Hydrogenophaga laconesensis TaxID=1805971 RepID=A0ABU1VGD5_9BURK|nr:hypothetical protein [Hydrogenophaga laconesensis]